MSIRKKNLNVFLLYRFFLVAFVFIMSLVISSYYTEGDQLHYRKVYLELSRLSLFEGYIFYH